MDNVTNRKIYGIAAIPVAAESSTGRFSEERYLVLLRGDQPGDIVRQLGMASLAVATSERRFWGMRARKVAVRPPQMLIKSSCPRRVLMRSAVLEERQVCGIHDPAINATLRSLDWEDCADGCDHADCLDCPDKH